MKRLLLLPILMLGLSFACDQPYEEVAGIKIGCPLKEIKDIRAFTSIDSPSRWTDSYVKALPKGSFFEGVRVTVSGDNVIGVDLVKAGVLSDKDMSDLTEEMSLRWGGIIPVDDSIILGWEIYPQESEALKGGEIKLTVSRKDEVTGLSYSTEELKKIISYAHPSNSAKKQESSKFKGL